MRTVAFAIVAIISIVVVSPLAWWYIDTSAEAMSEIGGVPLPMTFVVVDAETNKPVANALVKIHDRFDVMEMAQGQSEGRTDADGTLNLAPQLIWTSRGMWHRRRGSIRFWDKGIMATSAGYEPLNQDLETYTGSGRPLSDLSPVSIVIKMNRNRRD
jgi:hypothetical protein